MYIVKLLTNGSLDASFGTGGEVIIGGSGEQRGRSMVQASDGGYVIAGHTTNQNMYVIKLQANGSLDTSFGTGGSVTNSSAKNIYSIIKTALAAYGIRDYLLELAKKV
jgi:uncharacterized delta-60 repeat protein